METKDLLAELLANSYIDEKGCRLWTSFLYPSGYGKGKLNGETYVAHRASYKVFKGEIPEGLLVLHTCGVRNCINPEHLYAGTSKDNNNDTLARHEKPRARGRLQGSAILTETLVQQLRKDLKTQEPPKKLALKYGISYKTVIGIKNKRTWAWLPDA